jgi:hypothetical protein
MINQYIPSAKKPEWIKKVAKSSQQRKTLDANNEHNE